MEDERGKLQKRSEKGRKVDGEWEMSGQRQKEERTGEGRDDRKGPTTEG